MEGGSQMDRTSSTTWVRLWIVAVLAMVLTVSGCAGVAAKGTAEAHTAKPHTAKSHAKAAHSNGTRPLPNLGIPPTPTNLAPGRYVTNKFEPSVSFGVSKGWAINNPEKKDHFSVYSRAFARSDKESGAVLTFVDVRAIFDAKEPTEDNIHSAPKDLLAWFQHHPRLDISKPIPTTVGGVPVERFDASVSSLPKETLDECPDCLPVFGLQYEEPISIVKGFEQRVFLMEVPSGETVAIIFYAPPDRFDSYLPKAQHLLRTVQWTGA
jgi:uncharacterized protein YceK